MRTSPDTAAHMGDLVAGVNGRPIDSLARAFGAEIPAELEPRRRTRIAASFSARLMLREEWKTSAVYLAHMASQASPWIRWLPFTWFGGQARQLFGGPDGKVAVLGSGELGDRGPPENPRRVLRPFCVLIGPGTFSGAMLLANSIKQGKLGTLAGEPSGKPPSSFGEVYAFLLPRSALRGQLSGAAFGLDPDTLGGRRLGVLPDMEVARTADDVRAGRDPALDRARECALRPREDR
ncbi:MAG: hypothetical protein HYX65_01150 [Gemmatimonadetes bacterium]|nr:hypothetical protein [Gemmatimonadota bacterium]